MLTQPDPSSHWLAGQIADIPLFTLVGGMVIGAALAGLALGNEEVLVFLAAMLAGGLLQQGWARMRGNR